MKGLFMHLQDSAASPQHVLLADLFQQQRVYVAGSELFSSLNCEAI